uniref:Seminal fluid protein n=1 Tax=Nilaparvata lugens TaxID=108931 RepID=A0A220XIG0_NILLU|nr:hypothetical protein [Nilaparvata lugens]
MKSSVIFVLIFILLNGIELSHQARPPKVQRTKRAQTAPEAASSSNAAVELFDVLDSNKDQIVTRANFETFKQGSAFRTGRYDSVEIYKTIGSYANREHFTWRGNESYPSVDLRELNQNRDYNEEDLKRVLGINSAQAQKILEGERQKTANAVADYIRTKNFATDNEPTIRSY